VLDFRILGPLEVARDGQPIALGGQKQRALLALLLLRRGDVVPTERLIEELWGENAPRTASTSLQNFVSQLRKLIGPDVIETRPPGYRLQVDPEQFDLARFERLVLLAREHEPDRRAALLREALAIWRGQPLGDFVYEPFAQNEINRLEELRLAAVEERIEADLECGGQGELVAELEALVAQHPLRERLRGHLMLALYRAGRQAEALDAFHDARRALVDELGIEPSPELQRLHASILRQETRLDRAAPSSAAADDHYADVVKALLTGRLVLVLGPGVSPPGAPDVVEHLAKSFGYPVTHGVAELPRVSQYIATMTGLGPLYDALHELYATDFEAGDAHRFAAALARKLRDQGAPHPLVVTTGYDLALERAFTDAGEEFDVVTYAATGRNRGRFWHLAPNKRPQVIEVPNTYATELSLERRSIILKLHGCVDRDAGREWESFVVTEDDYIDYLARDDLANLIPVALTAKLRRSHFLFLGYALRDWNLRVLLNRLWGEEKVGYRSWAVQPEAPPLEIEFWRRRDVDVFELPVDEYVRTLESRFEEVRA
jgi:DNA-binding SARP family transcriptional activator